MLYKKKCNRFNKKKQIFQPHKLDLVQHTSSHQFCVWKFINRSQLHVDSFLQHLRKRKNMTHPLNDHLPPLPEEIYLDCLCCWHLVLVARIAICLASRTRLSMEDFKTDNYKIGKACPNNLWIKGKTLIEHK
jgi:hypothetical protein